jgi:hypothetical protein
MEQDICVWAKIYWFYNGSIKIFNLECSWTQSQS